MGGAVGGSLVKSSAVFCVVSLYLVMHRQLLRRVVLQEREFACLQRCDRAARSAVWWCVKPKS
jgi:hypothetical protein